MQSVGVRCGQAMRMCHLVSFSIVVSSLLLQMAPAVPAMATTAQEWQPEVVAPAVNGSQPDGFVVPYFMTPDGRYVVFSSTATNLIVGGAPAGQVYVRDRVANVTELVSVSSGGIAGNNGGFPSAISTDGRYVTFTSTASNLVSADTNGVADAFLHDRVSGLTERISVRTDGSQIAQGGTAGPVSDDGNIALFGSSGPVTQQTAVYNDGCTFSRNRSMHTTTDVLGAGVQNGFPYPYPSQNVSMTSDGRYVALSAHHLLPDDDGHQQGYLVDTGTGGVTRMTNAPDGSPGNGNFNGGSISTDGRFFAYTSAASNLDPAHPSAHQSTYLLDRSTGLTENVSVGNNGPLDADAANLSVSADGRYVAFQSSATNVVSPSTPSGRALAYVRDRSSQTTTLASVTSTGGTPNDHMSLGLRALSADGQHLLVYSTATDVFPAPTVSSVQAVLYDRQSDVDPPTIEVDAQRPPDSNGWYHSPVTMTFYCADSGSGLASCPAPIVLSSDGVHQVVSGTAVDNAGNSASTSASIDVDLTPPMISATVSPPANSYGWNNTDVAISYECSDALSGLAYCNEPVVLSQSVSNKSVTGRASDYAGNSARATVSVRIDKSKPVVTLTGPQQGGRYLLGRVPDAHCSTTDSFSGVATDASIAKVDNGDGTITVTCSGAVDRAGNVGDATSLTYTVVPPVFNVTTASKGSGFSSSIDATVGPVGVVPGDTVSVAVAAGPLTGAVGCSDTKGNTYAVVVDQKSARGRLFVCSAVVAHALGAGDKVTATYGGFGGSSAMSVNAVDALASDGSVVATNKASGSSATPQSGVVTNQASDVLFGAVAYNGAASFVPGEDFVSVGEVSSGSGMDRRTLSPVYRMLNGTQTLGVTGTLSASEPWRAVIVDYLGTPLL